MSLEFGTRPGRREARCVQGRAEEERQHVGAPRGEASLADGEAPAAAINMDLLRIPAHAPGGRRGKVRPAIPLCKGPLETTRARKRVVPTGRLPTGFCCDFRAFELFAGPFPSPKTHSTIHFLLWLRIIVAGSSGILLRLGLEFAARRGRVALGCGNLCLPVWRRPFRRRIRDLRCRGACDVCPGAPVLKVTGNCEQFSTSPISGSRNVCGGARELCPSRWKSRVLENDRKAETRTSANAPMTTRVAQQPDFFARASRDERMDRRWRSRADAQSSKLQILPARRGRNTIVEFRSSRLAPARPPQKAAVGPRDQIIPSAGCARAVAPTLLIPLTEVDLSTFRICAAERRRQKRMNEAIRCQC